MNIQNKNLRILYLRLALAAPMLNWSMIPAAKAAPWSTNIPMGASFTVLTASDPALPLASWMVLGTATETSPGQFQFTDPQATSLPQRFYQLRSP